MARDFGNYEILRKIASGGMAEVFLAKHHGLGGFERLVCIKRILPQLSEQEDFITMFQDEARIVANLTHPNIAQIYDIGYLQGTYYIAMEYVHGQDLRAVYNAKVARGHALPLWSAAHIAMGAASGLDFAHRQTNADGRPMGIVHRDVSPQNILVAYDGHIKLIDFGVAKAEGKLNETRSGVLKGKYSYMSPEQASDNPIDGRSDLFSLGITMYEVTTGVRLFKRDSDIDTLNAVIECQVPAPSDRVPGYDEEFQGIILRALARDPKDRFANAGEMERALEQFLVQRGHPVSASSLAGFMTALFADRLAAESRAGGPRGQKCRTAGIDSSAETVWQESLAAGNDPSPKTVRLAPSDDDAPTMTSDWPANNQSTFGTRAHPPPRRAPARATRRRASPSMTTFRPVPIPPARLPPSRWFPRIAVGTLLIGLSLGLGLVISSQRRSLEEVPHSGMLAIDSEPRGARVVFVGPGAESLNHRYDGHRTPFTIVEGVPVEHVTKLRLIKDGFEIAEVHLPEVKRGVEPETLFVQLRAITHGNAGTPAGL